MQQGKYILNQDAPQYVPTDMGHTARKQTHVLQAAHIIKMQPKTARIETYRCLQHQSLTRHVLVALCVVKSDGLFLQTKEVIASYRLNYKERHQVGLTSRVVPALNESQQLLF